MELEPGQAEQNDARVEVQNHEEKEKKSIMIDESNKDENKNEEESKINRARAITGKAFDKKVLFERSKSMSPVKKRKEASLIDYLFSFISKKVTNQILAGYFEVVVRGLYHHKTKDVI